MIKPVKMNKTKTNSSEIKSERTKWKYPEMVSVPQKFCRFLWGYPDRNAPLEIYLLRLLTYGKFEYIQMLFSRFPEQVYDVTGRYSQIHRGVKFWIRKWYE